MVLGFPRKTAKKKGVLQDMNGSARKPTICTQGWQMIVGLGMIIQK